MLEVLAMIIIGIVALCMGAFVGRLLRTKDQSQKSNDLMKETFRAAAGDAIQQSQEILLNQAKLLVENAKNISSNELQKQGLEMQKTLIPFQNTLQRLESELKKMESARIQEYGSLGERLKEVSGVTKELKDQTGNLLHALRAPQVRGSWGELQLKRAVEFAGMTNRVDFKEQVSLTTSSGEIQRPDMTIHLPNGRIIVVDAKVPLDAYLRALEAKNPDEKAQKLAEHAAQLKKHFKMLGQKQYWSQFSSSPEFVVLFLHTESLLSAALEQEPQLIEEAIKENILIATPTTLIALLKTVSFGWGEAKAAQRAKEIIEIGNELIERLSTVIGYWQDVGTSLGRAVEKYNQATISTQTRLIVTARKIVEAKAINDFSTIDSRPIENLNQNTESPKPLKSSSV